MGSSRKATIGYHYRPAMFFGLCQGPVDAYTEFVAGERTAWKGEITENAIATVSVPDLWGGEEAEGGIEGEMEVAFGEQSQQRNAWLLQHLGSEHSAYRGRVTWLWRGGRYGAMNPYPKPCMHRVRRIYSGWDNECWYPEKAAVVLSGGVNAEAVYLWRNTYSSRDKSDISDITMSRRDVVIPAGATVTVGFPSNATPDDNPRRIFLLDLAGTVLYDSGWLGLATDQAALNAALTAANKTNFIGPIRSLGPETNSGIMPVATTSTKMRRIIAYLHGTSSSLSYKIYQPARDDRQLGMNPAHIIYDARTSAMMQGEPIAAVDDENFRRAADVFHDEGFGLCATYDPDKQTIDAFVARICEIVGASCTRSRIDGRWRLDPLRGDYDIATLPIIDDDDIVDFVEEQAVLEDAVNHVTVEWYDRNARERRTTPAVYSPAAIRMAGKINSERLSYPEISDEVLAIRVATRRVLDGTLPLARYDLVATRAAYALSKGRPFRLRSPKRGIVEMVCIVGDIDTGTLRSGAIRMKVVQDRFGMPQTAYVQGEPAPQSDDDPPKPVANQRLIEAPYIELAGVMTPSEMASLDPDAGFALALAARQGDAYQFRLRAGVDPGALADAGVHDWCPTAIMIEGATQSASDVSFTISDARDLDHVQIGTAGLWGEEIIRLDALDVAAGTVVVARGCADTVPQIHAPGERIWFFDQWAASNRVEYATNETVIAKALPRVAGRELPESAAPSMSVTMNARAARPYPPAKLQVGGQWPAPATATGDLVLTWAQRNRVLQADQLLDWHAPSVTPEGDTRYGIRILTGGGQLIVERSNVAGDTATLRCAAAGAVNVQVWAINDNGPSLQRVEFTLDYTPAGGNTENAIDAPTWSPQQTIIDGGEVTA